MLLVHEKMDKPGRWEVAWMWLPQFLAADRQLHRLIDQEMTKEFKGTVVQEGALTHFLEQMNRKVIELILKHYQIPGLRQLLETYVYLNPEEDPNVPVGLSEETA